MPLEYPNRQKQLERLMRELEIANHALVRWDLLDTALTHPSASATANYEQLEFVGDAVIRLAAAEFLWENYGELPVGEFTAIRSVLVSDRILANLAKIYSLDRFLIASPSTLRDKAGETSRLADAFEAVLGALYLSTHTFKLVRPWLDRHFETLVDEIRRDPARQNYKAALQEWTQAEHKCLPEYRVQEANGAVSAERFAAEVWLGDRCLGYGTGRTIKAAEQAAAKMAFLEIIYPPEPPLEVPPRPAP